MDDLDINKYRKGIKFSKRELKESHELIKADKRLGWKYEDLDEEQSVVLIYYKRALIDDDFDAIEIILENLMEEE